MTGMTVGDTASWDDMDALEDGDSAESSVSGDTTQGWDDMPDDEPAVETEGENSSPEEASDKVSDPSKSDDDAAGKDDKDADDSAKSTEDKGKGDDEKDDVNSTQDEIPVKGKNIKGTIGDTGLKINTGMTVNVPVDGKKQPVSLQELMNDYSGRKATSKRFEEYGEKVKELKTEREEFDGKNQRLNDVLGDFTQKFTKAMEDGANTSDLSAPMDYLLDKMGLNVHEYKRKLFQSQFEEFENISEMDDTERKLYFAEQENEALRQIESSRYSKSQQARETQEAQQRFNQLREASNVSEEQFNKAAHDLSSKGYNADNHEVVIDHANKISAVERAEDILGRIDADLVYNDEVMSEIAELCYSNPRISDDRLLKLLKSEYITEENEELSAPEQYDTVYKRQGASQQDSPIESFDDYEY